MKAQKQTHKQAQAQAQAQAEVMEMEKRWITVSDYVGIEETVFDSLEELLRALEEIGVDTDAVEVDDGVLRSRAYTDGVKLIVEAFHEDFDYETWLRNPDWHVIAVEVREDEEE